MGTDVLVVLGIILVIVLIWQGPKNLPKLGQALGRSISDFRKEVSTDDKDTPAETTASTTPTTSTTTSTAPTAPPPPTAPTDQPGR